MPRFSPLLLLAFVLMLGATSCQMVSKFKHRKAGKDSGEEEGIKAIGTVEMVNPEAGFVIVHILPNSLVTPGMELTTIGNNGQSARLKVSPERKTIFITADIVSGEPAKGDTVLGGAGSATAVAATPPPVTPGAPLVSVQGIPSENLLRSAAPLPGSTPLPPADSLPLPTPQENDFLRIVPSGAPR